MAGNFIEGAMRNALSVQTNPAAHMGNAQRAFAGSGNLALKLTALVDQEEQNRQNHQLELGNQVLQAEQQVETARSHAADEALRGYGYSLQADRDKHNVKIDNAKLKISKINSIVNETEMSLKLSEIETSDAKKSNNYYTDATHTELTPTGKQLKLERTTLIDRAQSNLAFSTDQKLGRNTSDKTPSLPTTETPPASDNLSLPTAKDEPVIGEKSTPSTSPKLNTNFSMNTPTGVVNYDAKEIASKYGPNFKEAIKTVSPIAENMSKYMPLDANGDNTKPTGDGSYTSTGQGSDDMKLKLVRDAVGYAYGKPVPNVYFDKGTIRSVTKDIALADPIMYQKYKTFLTKEEMKELGPKLLEKAYTGNTKGKDLMWLMNNLLQDGAVSKDYVEGFARNLKGSEYDGYDFQTLIHNSQDAKDDQYKIRKMSEEDVDTAVDDLGIDSGIKVIKKATANNSAIPFVFGLQRTIDNKALLTEFNKQKHYSGYSKLETGIKYAGEIADGGWVRGQTVDPDIVTAVDSIYGMFEGFEVGSNSKPSSSLSKADLSKIQEMINSKPDHKIDTYKVRATPVDVSGTSREIRETATQLMSRIGKADNGAKMTEVVELLSAREATTGNNTGMPIILSDGTKVPLKDAKKIAGLYGIMAGVAFTHETGVEEFFIKLMVGERE